MDAPASEVTQLLNAWSHGDAQALDQLAPLVEAELRRVARGYLSREGPNHTLQPTALINEAYLKLIEWNSVEWQSRVHFYAVASKMMRRVLVNYALSRGSLKRGGDAVLVSLVEPSRLQIGRMPISSRSMREWTGLRGSIHARVNLWSCAFSAV